jgi:hypothetical protein
MLLNDIYYQAGEIEARALRRPSWASLHDSAAPIAHAKGPRQLVGHALMGLGRLIAAEPSSAATTVRAGR